MEYFHGIQISKARAMASTMLNNLKIVTKIEMLVCLTFVIRCNKESNFNTPSNNAENKSDSLQKKTGGECIMIRNNQKVISCWCRERNC
ncbi:hypothetical protein SADUNF_Sadunf08G0067700 [Salix dunnii]|uniref:Uncharacterized protein n=1 Tax=Salix dunnii TaxID=1413687 RepID=A0A835K1D1_9ROSI|nr:hypothetical protein SADUNF_Sadunf08G0067700 [Salix dunnii]